MDTVELSNSTHGGPVLTDEHRLVTRQEFEIVRPSIVGEIAGNPASEVLIDAGSAQILYVRMLINAGDKPGAVTKMKSHSRDLRRVLVGGWIPFKHKVAIRRIDLLVIGSSSTDDVVAPVESDDAVLTAALVTAIFEPEDNVRSGALGVSNQWTDTDNFAVLMLEAFSHG